MSPTLPFVQAPCSDMCQYKLRDCTCRSSICKALRRYLENIPVPQYVWKDKQDTGKVSFSCPGNHWHFEVPATDSRPNENKK